jgi:hypothetical protein
MLTPNNQECWALVMFGLPPIDGKDAATVRQLISSQHRQAECLPCQSTDRRRGKFGEMCLSQDVAICTCRGYSVSDVGAGASGLGDVLESMQVCSNERVLAQQEHGDDMIRFVEHMAIITHSCSGLSTART